MNSRLRVDSLVATLVAALGLPGCDDDPLPNITPTAYADMARTRPMVPVDIDVLANDGDPDGDADALGIELTTPPANATATITGNRVRVTPQDGFTGTIRFQYRARDEQGAVSAPAEVTVEVAPATRVGLVTYSASQPLERWSIADASDEWPVASHPTGCGTISNFVRNPSGTRLVIMTCGSELLLHNLVSVQPRAARVSPVLLAEDLRIHGNMVLSEDGSRLVVLQYDGDLNSVEGATNYQLVAIDAATGDVRRRMPIDGVELVYGISGAGPARHIYLQVRDDSSGVSHPAILTADLDTGSLARLETANPYNVLIMDGIPYANGEGLLFQYGDQRLYTLDSQSPEELQFPWEDPMAAMYPVWVIPGTDRAVVMRGQFPATPYLVEFWTVPLRNPGARQLIVPGMPGISAGVSIRGDGSRMLFASAPLPSLHTFVHEVSTEDGTPYGSVGPSGGIELLQYFQYLGPDGDVLVATGDAQTYERLSIIRRDQRDVLIPLATDLDYYGLVMNATDAEGTGVAFALAPVNSNGYFRAYLTDVNLPTLSVPLGAPRMDDEHVYVFGAFGTPLP